MTLLGARQRARTEDQKDERRRALVAAAERLVQAGVEDDDRCTTQTFDAITMADVAREAGVAKGSAYRYFTSKEALFLAVLERALADWFVTLTAELEIIRHPARHQAVAETIAATLAGHPTLLCLMGELHSRLETYALVEELEAFKAFLSVHLDSVGETIDRCADLRSGQGVILLERTYVLAVGLTRLSILPRPVRDALDDEPALSILQRGFEPELTTCLLALLQAAPPHTSTHDQTQNT